MVAHANHRRLLDSAQRALVDLFSDTTVPPSMVVESLYTLRDKIDSRIKILQEEVLYEKDRRGN